ncbi:MAG: dihydroneopterin aldolase [Candidatus Marinimicrobia bacterium]|nr:dihydroneopterin aldolase [Candidatus Neomarinimicrobiota bacterium]
MDRITLNNMVFFGYHGAMSEEQEIGGRFEVDIDLLGDFSQASKSDDLSKAVDYQKAYESIKPIIEGKKYYLIEGLAEAVAKKILGEFEVSRVNVRLRKRNVPIGGVIDFVEVELTRDK